MSPRPAVHVRSVATAVPPNATPQSELAAFATRFFGDAPELSRTIASFANARIDERQLARPMVWYETPHTFADKNEVYREVAMSLSERAAREALEASGLVATDIAAILFVSSTGIATPSLDAALSQQLGLRSDVMRVPIWGLGCAGGAAGLSRAAALCAGLDAPVLLVCVEVCSVTFVQDDRSPRNIIATAIFGDGGAAVVLAPGDGEGPRVLGGHSHLLADSESVMGWDLRAAGLAVRFSPGIPAITRRIAPVIVREVCQRFRLRRPPEQLVLHPGGAKVIDAYEAALELPPDSLRAERAVLREHGNMSSPSVLFVLQRVLREPPPPGTHGLVLGLGPGFCAEAAVLAW